MPEITPSQTVGPFFHYGLMRPDQERIAPEGVPGQRIVVEGRVLDGDGQPLADAMIEVWQADADGRYRHPLDSRPGGNAGFRGFGRIATDQAGYWRAFTVKPGPVGTPDGAMQAPHLNLTVFGRGILTHLFTRLYFEDEALNATDPALSLVDPGRRATLIARRHDGDGAPAYVLDIRIQGDDETVFFEV